MTPAAQARRRTAKVQVGEGSPVRMGRPGDKGPLPAAATRKVPVSFSSATYDIG